MKKRKNKKATSTVDKTRYTAKKCWSCLTPLALDVKRCHSCGQRVGEINAIGLAIRPIDWLAYLYALLAVAACGGFFYWLFFVKG